MTQKKEKKTFLLAKFSTFHKFSVATKVFFFPDMYGGE